MCLISLIMSSYNDEIYIDRCLESLVEQTHQTWELIAVDDCSTDATLDKLLNWSQLDHRVTVLENTENHGLAASLNRALQHVEGDFIARMDADDECMPTRLSEQVQFMIENPSIDILGTSYFEIDGAGTQQVLMPQFDSQIKQQGFLRPMFCHPTVMFRPDILNHLKGYDAKLRRAQDKDLWFRAIRCGAKFHNIQQPLLKYYRFPKSHSLKNTINKFKANASISIKHRSIKFGFLTIFRLILDVGYEHMRTAIRQVRMKR